MKAKVKTDGTVEETLLTLLSSSTKTAVRKLVKYRRVLVDGAAISRTDMRLSAGQQIEIVREGLGKDKKKTFSGKLPGGKRPPFIILMEDEHIIVVDKPSGVLSIATDKEKLKTIYRKVSDYVKASSGEKSPIFIVHRLDKDVSGVMVFAKNATVKRTMQDNWAGAVKVYRAVVAGHPSQKEGTITSWLCENAAHNVYECKETTKGAEKAVTHYKMLKSVGSNSVMEIKIETGKKHQIRVHMASIGCPIAGDKLYGTRVSGMSGIALHAITLEFDHPVTGERTKIKSPVPSRMKGL